MNNRNRGYDIGDIVKIPCLITDDDNTLCNPDSITLYITPPTAAPIEFTFPGDAEIVEAATGSYYSLHTAAESGEHHVISEPRWLPRRSLVGFPGRLLGTQQGDAIGRQEHQRVEQDRKNRPGDDQVPRFSRQEADLDAKGSEDE